MPKKLIARISINNLIENLDKVNVTWNEQEVLGCLLPNYKDGTIIINAELLIRTKKH